jgi:hypothetical protein
VISGSGTIKTSADAVTVDAVISRSGDIWTLVNRQLKATVSGSGNVIFRGNPQVESLASDSGNVIHKN